MNHVYYEAANIYQYILTGIPETLKVKQCNAKPLKYSLRQTVVFYDHEYYVAQTAVEATNLNLGIRLVSL